MRGVLKLNLLLLFAAFTFSNLSAQSNKPLYKSETLEVSRVSKHTLLHLSYLDTKSFGKVACNGMIVVNNGEAVIFDTTCDNASSKELIDYLTLQLGYKIKAVIPCHYHDDNLMGLNAFHKAGIPSYALNETIQKAKDLKLPLPQNSYNDSLILNLGSLKVITDYQGGGHTPDNVIGYVPEDGVLFGGCLIKSLGSDKGNIAEADVENWSETVQKIKTKYPSMQIVIPGHGECGNTNLLDYTINMFK